ncbi:MAG: homocysteine S-methyltransferase family protein [Clostridia bacterium]|nr:homocysteine S-methyltransferase family protein [Clostridia bacterium]
MNILEFLKDRLLLLDGGMGTLLQEEGLAPGELPERWNLTHPDRITSVHRRYFAAGSHAVSANTFGANCLKLGEGELEDVISAGIRCARTAAEEFEGPRFVGLDVGPTGRILKPFGDLDFEDAVEIFAKTVRLGVKYGADFILIETMNDSYETKAALLAAKENSRLPVFVSNAYEKDGMLMTGASAAAMAALCEGMGADAVGLNCSFGPEALRPVAEALLSRTDRPILFKPNAGLPSVREGKTVYDVGPAEFAASVAAAVKAGVRIVGGCCGTTPEHIRAVAEALAGMEPARVAKGRISCVSSYTHTVDFGSDPVLIGERINPTGKKKLKAALLSHDMDYLLTEGVRQKQKGAHVLDVNVGLPELDEVSTLTEAVTSLQAILDTPLQIDTASPAAMEAALRRYNGKALINSVNGKRESMEAVFPLVKKYGGMIVALTLDESGIPPTAEGRCAIAQRILAVAEEYGIGKESFLFDPLAMTVSADQNAALVTLESLRLIRERTGCLTSLGVSNVSFGLPRREIVNSVFFASALANGLSAAILNPDSEDMMKVYYAHRALYGRDENCASYLSYAAALPERPVASASAAAPVAGATGNDLPPIQAAIVTGRAEAAARQTAQALAEGRNPMAVVEEEVLPALDRMGKGFEEKTVYLPQLLMSAEAAKAAFEEIKAAMPAGAGGRLTVILATVHGDIHDIGKNIVRLLLENYGFRVVDLGRDVPPTAVLDAVRREQAPLLGLSALMTTTVGAMEDTIRLVREHAPTCRIMVGGAVLTEEYANKIGADRYCRDAMGAVRYAESVEADLASGK